MDKEDIQKNLVSFGLSAVEAGIYIAVLSLENAPVEKIARFADTNRTSTYPILERLENTGLISRSKKRGKTFFQAAPPGKFLEILEEKKGKVEKILPELKNLFALQAGRPTVRMFSGAEGLKTVLGNILAEATTEILIFSDGESFLKKIPGWVDVYLKKRAKKRIRTRLILKATAGNIEAARQARVPQTGQTKVSNIRLLPQSYDIRDGGFDIYNNKVVLYSFDRQNVAVEVESKTISRLLRTTFEILWNEAGKYDYLFTR